MITYGLSKDKEHLKILKEKAIIYKNEKDLMNIFNSIESILKVEKDWNAYKEFNPINVMTKFKKICLDNNKKSFLKLTSIFLKDLPWEILVFLKYIYNNFRSCISKLIPISVKRKVKNIQNKNFKII